MYSNSIAICVSGQIRTPMSALIKIADEAAAINADLFVSIWSEKGSKTFHGAVGPKNIRRIIGKEAAQLLPDNWLGRMREVFPNSDSFFPEKKSITQEELERIFPDAIVEVESDGPEFDLNARDSNSLRMLYKIWRANQLKKQREEERGSKYERVIRVRPDMLFNGSAVVNLRVKKDSLFVQGHVGDRQHYINDTIWVSSSESDDALCSLYHRCLASKSSDWRGIHRELSDHVESVELKPLVAKIVKTGIQDFCAASEQNETIVRDNLLSAVKSLELDTEHAGGEEFCRLVSLVVGISTGDDGPRGISKNSEVILQQLNEVEEKNRRSYFQSIIYLSNICLLDSSIPSLDRTEIMFRILSYYCHQGATVFLDVRITELSELFSDDPAALSQAVLAHANFPQEPETEFAQIICEKLESLWDVNIRENNLVIRQKVAKFVFRTPAFIIDLHRKLSMASKHEEACKLAEEWIKNSPDNWRGYDLLASSNRALGNVKSVHSIYLTAERKAAPHTRIQELKGKLLVELKQYEEARIAFDKSLSLPGCNRNRVLAQLRNVESFIEKS